MCSEGCGKALIRIRMIASPCLRICDALMAGIALLHCFYLRPVTKEDWGTIVLGTVKVWSWKQLRLTDINSLNKWYYDLEIARFVYGCSSLQIVTVSFPTSRSLSCVSWQSACLPSSSNKCSHSLTIYLWLCGIPNRPSERELFLP